MEASDKREQFEKSMLEFEKRFFPESLRNRLWEADADTRSPDIDLPKRSLDKIRRRLIYRHRRGTA